MQIPRVVRCSLLALLMLVIPASSYAGVFVSVTVAPPVLPVYVQPPCPGDGYIWTPGYWAYGPDGYYWVPGTWVVAPEVGVLWTPGYWGWGGGVYVWHAGYWGPHIGFYGGVNYGFGYFGTGYEGGYWGGNRFYYNRTVNNINITNVNVYNKTVINNNVTVNRVSYNGGAGGVNARPTRFEETAARERHFEATHMQMQHEHAASSNRELLASVNHGRPAIAATARPGEFRGRGVVAARSAGGPYRPAENRPAENRMASRQENSGRNVPRPQVSREQGHSNRTSQPMRNEGRPEARTRMDSAPRPSAARVSESRVSESRASAPRASASRPENTRQHESPPRGERESRPENGNDRDRKPH